MAYIPRHSAKRSFGVDSDGKEAALPQPSSPAEGREQGKDDRPSAKAEGAQQPPAEEQEQLLQFPAYTKPPKKQPAEDSPGQQGAQEQLPKPEIVFTCNHWPVREEPVEGDVVLIDIELQNPNDYEVDIEVKLSEQFSPIFAEDLRVEQLAPAKTHRNTVKCTLDQLSINLGTLFSAANIKVEASDGQSEPMLTSCPMTIKFRD